MVNISDPCIKIETGGIWWKENTRLHYRNLIQCLTETKNKYSNTLDKIQNSTIPSGFSKNG